MMYICAKFVCEFQHIHHVPHFRLSITLPMEESYMIHVRKATHQALIKYCQIFVEDIEHTLARFFPVPNLTTPKWCEKVRALEKIDLRHQSTLQSPLSSTYTHLTPSTRISNKNCPDGSLRQWRLEMSYETPTGSCS